MTGGGRQRRRKRGREGGSEGTGPDLNLPQQQLLARSRAEPRVDGGSAGRRRARNKPPPLPGVFRDFFAPLVVIPAMSASTLPQGECSNGRKQQFVFLRSTRG